MHFDGYPNDYDFWVNADCPDLFYANWCNEHSRTLEPPKNYKKPFNWSIYLSKSKATPVPKNILVSTISTTVSITVITVIHFCINILNK